ncbi:MAG TPA: hypothetical protein PK357_02890 [Candidatus Pacearchaeota archaeon]|nr:hypothetical protein [Candidatus Pacearchaeota archaeon]
MNKIIFIVIFFVIFSIFLLIFIIDFTNNSLKNYSWTKAVCNKTHCQDHEIICNGNEIVSISPIVGAVIKISDNWEDSRDKKYIEEYCADNNIFKPLSIN